MSARCVRRNPSLPQRQTGIALFVGLVLLIVITLMAVAGARIASLESRMESAQRNSELAFQSAEAALRGGENYVDGLDPSVICATAGTSGITHGFSPHYAAFVNPLSWPSTIGAAHGLASASGQPELVQAPRYLIETLEFVADAGPEFDAGVLGSYGAPGGGAFGCGAGGGTGLMYYRVTARGTGAEAFTQTPATSAILQSVIVKRR
jgi:type IV pilus assembly protein PilX